MAVNEQELNSKRRPGLCTTTIAILKPLRNLRGELGRPPTYPLKRAAGRVLLPRQGKLASAGDGKTCRRENFLSAHGIPRHGLICWDVWQRFSREERQNVV